MCASDVTFWEGIVLLVELTFKTSLMEFPVVSRFEWKSLQDVFKGQKKSNSVAIYPTNPKAMFRFADSKLLFRI